MRMAFMASTALAMAASAYTPVMAQQQPAEKAFTLEEIMVTATRRETDLQSTPIAISALDARTIEQSAPRNLGDLAAFVPNFSASKITGFNAASFAMRGVGQNNIIVYYEAPVAVLVDDFVMPSVQTQLLDPFDVEQVEVLRGPQGTLFGKNTTGGAVAVRTKKPDVENFGAQARASYGSFNSFDFHGAINAPLVKDKLALRIVGGYEKSDGYMRNGAAYGPVTGFAPSKWDGVTGKGDGERVGGTDVFNARVKLLWKPTDNLDALLQYEIVRDKSDSPPAVNETPAGAGFLFNLLGFPQGSGDPRDRAGVSNRSGYLVDVDKGHIVNVDGLYLTLNYDTGAGTITNVAGYRNQRSRLANNYTGDIAVAPDGEVMSMFDANRSDNHKTFQEELRFASAFDGPFNFVGGAFYQNDKIDFCVAQLLGFQDLVGATTPYGSWNTTPFLLCNNQRAHSEAVFAEGNYNITEKLIFTLGARYTWEKKTWMGRQQTFVQDLSGTSDPTFTWQQLGRLLDAADFDKYPAGVVTDSKSWSEPTWRLSLSYQATDDVFGYFTYTRGFKSGAYNDQIGSFAPFGNNLDAFRAAASPTNPEKADSFELGVKTQAFDDRLRFNLTGFFVTYKDVQKQIVVPITVNGQPFQVTRFFNAAKMEVKGIEAEATVLPADGLTIRGVLGYQDGKYKEYTTPIPAGYDLATAPIDRAPKWTWTVDATYDYPVADKFHITVNGNVSYTARNLFTQSIDTPADNTFLDARTLVNASITFSDINDNYYVRFIGRNLTDQIYRTASQTVGGLWTDSLFGERRSYTAEVGVKF